MTGLRRCPRCGNNYPTGGFRLHAELTHTQRQRSGPWMDATVDRNRSIAAQVKSGRTLQSVADEYGLTRERVRQIAKRMEAL